MVKNMKYKDPTIEQQVHTIIKDCMDVSDLNNESHIINDIGADSLDCVEILVTIESEFEIDISNEDAEKLKTVGQAVEYVKAAWL